MYAELVGNMRGCCPRRRTGRYDSGESGYQAMVWRMSFPLTMKMTISATLVA